MYNEDQYFQKDPSIDLWQRYCGFLDLSLDEFMHIQQGLLKEQMGFLSKGIFQNNILPPKSITSLNEFRTVIPLSRYNDYAVLLADGNGNTLKEKPDYWVHTSSVKGSYKRVPWASRFNAVQYRSIIAALILSSSEDARDVKLSPGCRILHLLPDLPFASGSLAQGLLSRFSLRTILPFGEIGSRSFTRRIDDTLAMGLKNNVDYAIAMTSYLVKMGDRFNRVWNEINQNPLNRLKLHPQVNWHLLKGKNHDQLIPSDAWTLKGLVCWGTDSTGMTDILEKQWGRKPLQIYGSSEGGIMAMQDWHKSAMNLLPDVVFFEFIPEEQIHSKEPTTVLIDEVKEGRNYELVISNFYGMPLTRYRQGDLFKIVKDGTGDKNVPKMIFVGRADDTIDIFGISRINNEVLSEALRKVGLNTENWCTFKEYDGNRVILNIYLESDQRMPAPELGNYLNRAIKAIDRHWGEAVFTMAYNPIRMNFVPQGTFHRLGFQVQPNPFVRVNPPTAVLAELVHLSQQFN